MRESARPGDPEIHELPYDVAFAILTEKIGYTIDQAREIIAISRGDITGDVQPETDDTR